MSAQSTHLAVVTDGRQLQRELAMLTETQGEALSDAMNRGETVMWVQTEFAGDIVVATPRLCFG